MPGRRLLLALALLAPAACLSAVGTRSRELLVPPPAEREAYAESLVADARRQLLAQSRGWLRLGHWATSWTGGVESDADGDNFFLSPRGRVDPAAELDATLRGFLSDLGPYDDNAAVNKDVQHPICQFPARLLFLSEKLHIDPARLPRPDCHRWVEFATSVDARSVTFVFSSYYLNNPASAFGHTFLRVNKRGDGVAESKRQLLDFGIDYSAAVDTTFAPVYAVKGIFGLFPGVFGKVPFYYKVREYNDFESRDLWEYDLALTDRQLAMLVAHVWELGSTFFRYYYLSANCSYHVLGLLDVAAPELALVDGLHTPVLPSDTVKALTSAPGLVRAIHYRPSLRSQFRARVAGLSGPQRTAVERLATDPAAPVDGFSDAQRIEIFDAAEDLIDLHYAKEIVEIDRERAANVMKQKLLERRAAILSPSHDPPLEPPWLSMPQLGHGSRRVALGGGGDADGGRWLELGARLALHDLADPAVGYPELSELEFAPVRLRWDLERDHVELEQLDLVHVRSLTGQDRFDPHVSWEMRVGSERPNLSCDCYAFHVQIGGGAALTFADDAFAIFLLGETHIWISGGLDGIRGSAFGTGLGPMLGVRWRLARSLVTLVTAEWLWMPDQTPGDRLRIDGTLRWAMLPNLAVELGGQDAEGRASGSLATMLYF